eukprot:TRINITY_DN18087_c1_g1_i3.p2 TRINITY_DN18087_c1_g1~~TRINITY_DN18087_c1_g1_i3.p2  ORF type:complete len:101 (-),score=4.16 TRINITY_DN18087_c1_g1_i3:200-502(-)
MLTLRNQFDIRQSIHPFCDFNLNHNHIIFVLLHYQRLMGLNHVPFDQNVVLFIVFQEFVQLSKFVMKVCIEMIGANAELDSETTGGGGVTQREDRIDITG